MGVPLDQVEGGVTRRLPHGEVIARQGDVATGLFLVLEGVVRLSSVTVAGREVVVGLLCPGDLFGEAALLGDPSPVRAQAVGPTIVLALPISTLHSTIERNPATAEELLRLIAARLHRTASALEDALVGDLATRLMGRLRDLAAHHGVPSGAGIRVRIPVTQDELARMVGASREAVNRTVGALSARGLIRSKNGRLEISDPQALGQTAARGRRTR